MVAFSVVAVDLLGGIRHKMRRLALVVGEGNTGVILEGYENRAANGKIGCQTSEHDVGFGVRQACDIRRSMWGGII